MVDWMSPAQHQVYLIWQKARDANQCRQRTYYPYLEAMNRSNGVYSPIANKFDDNAFFVVVGTADWFICLSH